MPRNNCYIYGRDSIRTALRDEAETIEMFGLDFLEEYGHQVPKELIVRYQNACIEMNQILEQLNKIKQEQENDRYE